MPIDVENAKKSLNVKNVYSVNADIIMCINILADPKHHQVFSDFVCNMKNIISFESEEMLMLIAQMPYQGIEFMEFVLAAGAEVSTEELIKSIYEYDDVDFIYTLTGEQLEKERIREILKDENSLEEYINEIPTVYRGSSRVYNWVFYNTLDFKKSLGRLILDIDNDIFKETIKRHRREYQKAFDYMEERIKCDDPCIIASEIMQRSIDEDSLIKEYIFIPSYFVEPHYVMAFKKDSRMILYRISDENDKRRVDYVDDMSIKLKILSDKTRLEILRLIILQPASGKILASRLKLTAATISHHIDLLRSVKLIKESRDKNTKYYSACTEEIDGLIDKFRDYIYNK